MARTARTGGFFIGDKYQSNAVIPEKARIPQGHRGIDHRRQTALHVRRSASKQIRALYFRLELRAALRRHDIVVTAEIERSLAFPHKAQNAVAFAPRLRKSEFAQPARQELDGFRVAVAR